jgi:mannose/fructose/N-acetylgalactosamine-specific phosphotransferase system component IID
MIGAFNPYLILAGFLTIGAAGTGGYWKGYSNASTACDSARYQAEVAGLTDLVGTMAQRLVTINEAATADAARATADAQRLAELQELIDAIPENADVCLDADGARRLRNIR